jgi:NAD(P)-dependent dehydrogenase (short-subunit alcohol dehydrogenase family)
MTQNKVWFVTGASRGLGLTLVKRLLSEGYKVVATSRNAADLESQIILESPITEHRKNLLPLTVDLTDEASVKSAIARTIQEFGRLDVVVNNAGYFILGSLEEVSDREFRQSVDVNLIGTVNVIRSAMPVLRKQRSGHIFNLSSTAGYIGYGNAGSYNAVKFAVIGLSEALALEAKPFGIRVTVVAPGYFRTSFLDKGSVRSAYNKIPEYNSVQLEEAMQRMDGNQPGDPAKLAAALVQLAGETDPPVHLLMGPDAWQTVTEKRKTEDREFETWKHLTQSTNF